MDEGGKIFERANPKKGDEGKKSGHSQEKTIRGDRENQSS